jgi:CheY-like chemotaxis protein
MIKNNLSVLIVEDDSIQAMLLELIITKFGHNVCFKATTGKEAIEISLKLKPEVIVMDIMLADDIDGIQAATEIQKHIDVKIIYLSGNTDPDKKERASKTDYLAFIQKPYSISRLEQIFNEIEIA